MTRARNLANLGNKNALTADVGNFNIGIGSTQPTNYKLEVVGGNAYVGGGVTITGNLSVGGTVTYEDVTNVDAVGIVTAQKGLRVTAGGVVVTAGIVTASNGIDFIADISGSAPTRIDVGNNTMVFKLPYNAVQTLFNGSTNTTEYTIKKDFDGTVSSNQVSISVPPGGGHFTNVNTATMISVGTTAINTAPSFVGASNDLGLYSRGR